MRLKNDKIALSTSTLSYRSNVLPTRNPTDSAIAEIITRSEHKAAKWIKDLDTGDIYYWEAEKAFHQQIADTLHIGHFDKGFAVNDS